MHAKFLMKKLIFSPHFVHLRGFHSRAYRIILCFNSKRDGTLETSVKKVSAGEKKVSEIFGGFTKIPYLCMRKETAACR